MSGVKQGFTIGIGFIAATLCIAFIVGIIAAALGS